MNRPRVAILALLALAGCDNAGAGRSTGISATGIIRGAVYFDANGSRTSDASDAAFAGARVRVLAPVSGDTILRVTTDANGAFRLAGVPVGSYRVVIDSLSGGDSAIVVPAAALVTVTPSDSVTWVGSLSFPIRTVAQARAMAPGPGRIFVPAIALNAQGSFSDTTIHLMDASGAIRATRVRPSTVPVAAGDSIRVRARIGSRAGQVVLDDVTAFVVSSTFIPTTPVLTTLQASTGDGGTRDAQLIRLIDAQVIDTVTVAGNLTMRLNDGSGPVTVVLDRAADVGFRVPFPAGTYVAPNRFDVTGLLVPTGLGTWLLKPRSALDLLRR